MATKVSRQRPIEVATKVPLERRYFAILAQQQDLAKFKGKSNPAYEEIECVGLQPELNLLEAIIRIKQNGGYSGGICATGSLEYVRFYADYNNDGNWQDLGYGNVRVHDIAGPKPLCYSVKLTIDPPKKYCGQNNVVKIRAILSWNALPTPNTPSYTPVWGGVLDVNVQTEPTRRIPIGVIASQFSTAKLSEEVKAMLANIDATAVLDAAPKPLTLEQRFNKYREEKIGVDRFAFSELSKLAMKPAHSLSISDPIAEYLPNTNALLKLLGGFVAPKGNTTYEEVNCVGLRPEDDTVAAVLTVKKNNGYSGDLCSTGSREYVAFWLELGGTWHHLGTSSVRVHDLARVPAGGVQYAVVRPVDLTEYLKACTSGPVVGTLRAVLSWNTPPSSTDPWAIPYWGNREDCRVQLRPAEGGSLPRLFDISNVDPVNINAATGLTNDGNAPFGGIVAVHGKLGTYAAGRKYKVEVGKSGGPLNPLMNTISVRTSKEESVTGNAVDCDTSSPGFNNICVVDLTPDASGWYDYLNVDSGGVRTFLLDDALGYWPTSVLDEGLWDIRVVFKVGMLELPTETVTVRIDNSAPSIHADLDEHNLGDTQCGSYTAGHNITGHFQAHDPSSNGAALPSPSAAQYQHFSAISTQILPSGNPVVMTVGASTGTSLSLGPTGADGTFALDSTGMKPCGYVIRFWVSDRTIVGYFAGGAVFQTTNFSNVYDVGFCLQ